MGNLRNWLSKQDQNLIRELVDTHSRIADKKLNVAFDRDIVMPQLVGTQDLKIPESYTDGKESPIPDLRSLVVYTERELFKIHTRSDGRNVQTLENHPDFQPISKAVKAVWNIVEQHRVESFMPDLINGSAIDVQDFNKRIFDKPVTNGIEALDAIKNGRDDLVKGTDFEELVQPVSELLKEVERTSAKGTYAVTAKMLNVLKKHYKQEPQPPAPSGAGGNQQPEENEEESESEEESQKQQGEGGEGDESEEQEDNEDAENHDEESESEGGEGSEGEENKDEEKGKDETEDEDESEDEGDSQDESKGENESESEDESEDDEGEDDESEGEDDSESEGEDEDAEDENESKGDSESEDEGSEGESENESSGKSDEDVNNELNKDASNLNDKSGTDYDKQDEAQTRRSINEKVNNKDFDELIETAKDEGEEQIEELKEDFERAGKESPQSGVCFEVNDNMVVVNRDVYRTATPFKAYDQATASALADFFRRLRGKVRKVNTTEGNMLNITGIIDRMAGDDRDDLFSKRVTEHGLTIAFVLDISGSVSNSIRFTGINSILTQHDIPQPQDDPQSHYDYDRNCLPADQITKLTAAKYILMTMYEATREVKDVKVRTFASHGAAHDGYTHVKMHYKGREVYGLPATEVDRERIETIMNWGGSDGHPALYMAIEALKNEPGKKLIIYIADDDSSGAAETARALEYARAEGITPYTIMLNADGNDEESMVGTWSRRLGEHHTDFEVISDMADAQEIITGLCTEYIQQAIFKH